MGDADNYADPLEADPLEAVAEAYRHDPPCITEAMKSLCSYLAATDLVEEAGSGRKPHVSESSSGVVTVSLTHELPHLLSCAKVVLKQINAHTLPHPAEWAEAHPQGDDESAMTRIDAIARYKACHLLAAQLQATPGAKRTKLLGRRYLRTTSDGWGALREAAEAELEVLHIPERTVEAFMHDWALAVDGMPQRTRTPGWQDPR